MQELIKKQAKYNWNLRPEIFNCVEASNLNLTIFPTAIAFNFEEPEGPGVL